MYSFPLVRLAPLCFAMVLGACSSNPQRNEGQLPGSQLAVNVSPNAALVTAEAGSTVELPAGNSLDVTRVQVLDEYQAASGRRCRRVQLPRASDSIRIMCERSNGQWTFTRALISTGMNERIHGRSAAMSVVDDHDKVLVPDETLLLPPDESQEQIATSAPPVQLRLGEGETLWRFAGRTTGNPENWKRIAEFNGIGDVATMHSGALLKIPADLYSGMH
ncbi:MAG: hypothetical protein HKN42_01580 [Granulosicoccus sp.]|nr:hypothetical protein [Granulosicoccus sp.]